MKLPDIVFNQEELSRFNEALGKEWLITNGLGGYASSTILGVNTRKYHGLLVAALHPPGDRTVCLSKLDEDVWVGKDFYQLGANEFNDAIYPQGNKLLQSFTIAPFPIFTYALGSTYLQKTVFMPKNKNVVAILYKISNKNDSKADILIYPLLTCRHFHITVDQQRNPLHFSQKSSGSEFEVAFQNPKATFLCRITNGIFNEKINWVQHLFYRAEAARGEANIDDCFQPGCFEVQVPAGEEKEFAVTLAVNYDSQTAKDLLDSIGCPIDQVKASFNQELTQQSNVLQGFYGLHPQVPLTDWLNWVLLAANSFMVNDAAGNKAIVAGYHWFETWGRDTFISLPGLLLVTDRFNSAKDVLQNFMVYLRDGLIPNYVSDSTGESAYNTVDATLWYIKAVHDYLKYTGDYPFVRSKLWGKLQTIISSHEHGTSFNIRLDSDGLLKHGEKLTWMDAQVNGVAVTPRAGKAVEVQALWYNALRSMQSLAVNFADFATAQKYGEMADRARTSFNQKFWNPTLGCLFDVLVPGGVDASVRPNQLFAISLDYPILHADKWRPVVDVVNREHVTSYGLRTLSPSDPKFIGKYLGDRTSRDRSYHNGTIWPWLLGPFISAYSKTMGNDERIRESVLQELLLPFFTNSIRQAGLGTISEICDADQPNLPNGCIAQAWSVAEPLRAYVEDVLLIKPRFRSI